MTGASQPRIDSRRIDTRQRQALASDRATAQIGRDALDGDGSVGEFEPTPALDPTPDKQPGSGVDGRAGRSMELRALSPGAHKSFENRLRRMADRQGLHLIKSRRRDRSAADHGKYMLVDALTSDVATGGNWSLDLADVEQILVATDPAARRLHARDCPGCGTATYSLSGLVKGALVDERECPGCGHSFVASPTARGI